MPIASRHEEAIRALKKPELDRLLSRFNEAFVSRKGRRPRGPDGLISILRHASVHPKDLAAPFFTTMDALELAILECLMGHKITRGVAIAVPRGIRQKDAPKRSKRALRRQRRRAEHASVRDANGKMIIRLLCEGNPKRPGTKAAEKFAKYRDGMLVEVAYQKGLKRSNLRWDEKHGFIRLEEPRKR